jgi:hypothetical protein
MIGLEGQLMPVYSRKADRTPVRMAVNETTFVRTLLVLLQCSMGQISISYALRQGDEKQRRFTHTLMLLASRALNQHTAWETMSE